MKLLISGSSGLMGSALRKRLDVLGHEVVRLRRGSSGGAADVAVWDPEGGVFDAGILAGVDGVVHLAGENIASGRWTAARRRRIMESRIRGTALLADALASCSAPPRVFLSASAVGFYGDRGEDLVREIDPPGTGFLSEVCTAWEAAADPARRRGVRVVHPRFGVILSTRGGALARMLPVFRAGLGGRLGSGRQFISWISLDDAVEAVVHLVTASDLAGAVNVCAPAPARNTEFTTLLAGVLRRPAVCRVPGVVLQAVLGEMARELLLSGARVDASLLAGSGFRFRHPHLAVALADVLKRRV